jgi:hypothetical protein
MGCGITIGANCQTAGHRQKMFVNNEIETLVAPVTGVLQEVDPNKWKEMSQPATRDEAVRLASSHGKTVDPLRDNRLVCWGTVYVTTTVKQRKSLLHRIVVLTTCSARLWWTGDGGCQTSDVWHEQSGPSWKEKIRPNMLQHKLKPCRSKNLHTNSSASS